MSGTERRIQRRLNMLAAFTAMGEQPLSIAQLAQRISVSRPATEQVVADLNHLHWLQQLEPQIGGGRPAVRWGLKTHALTVLSLDIGAHHVTATLALHNGEIVGSHTIQVEEGTPAQRRVDQACTCAEDLAHRLHIRMSTIRLACVGSPGAISDGTVIYFGGHGMPGWQGLDLSQQVSARLKVPVVVAGDCALGALAESWKGGARGHEDVVYILSGMRTGAAAIIGGRVHFGHQGSAGLIGELSVLQWKDIEEEAFTAQAYHDNTLTAIPERQEIFKAAQNGDDVALSVVHRFSDALALGTAAMVLALGPSHVVVGGEFSLWSDLFLNRFEEKIQQFCPMPPSVSASALKDQAVSLGGVKYALDYLSERLKEQVINTGAFPDAEHFTWLPNSTTSV